MKEALGQLKALQTERRDRRNAEMDDAIRLLKAQEMKGLPFDPQDAANRMVSFMRASKSRANPPAATASKPQNWLEKAHFNLIGIRRSVAKRYRRAFLRTVQ